jgi:hypothetical protein
VSQGSQDKSECRAVLHLHIQDYSTAKLDITISIGSSDLGSDIE